MEMHNFLNSHVMSGEGRRAAIGPENVIAACNTKPE